MKYMHTILMMCVYDRNGNLTKSLFPSVRSMSYDINNRLRRATSRQTVGEATWDYSVGHLSGADGVLRRSTYYYGKPDDTGSTASVQQRALSNGSPLIPGIGGKDSIFTEQPLRMHERTIEYCGDYRYDYIGMLTSPEVTLQFPQGYRDTDGWHFYLRDHLGNVRLVCSPDCAVEEFYHYYPYGEPMAESSYGSFKARRFTGKESDTWLGVSLIDNDARFKLGMGTVFNSVDRLADQTPGVSPYLFCGGDPINHIDPTGCIIEGVRKKDAAMAVEDFRAMFPGEEFANFRELIVRSGKKQNGKSFAPISPEALSEAFDGITLNEDQQALVEMVVNTINSADIHKIEYLTPGKEMSQSSLKIYEPKMNAACITPEMALNAQGGYAKYVLALCGEASTTMTPSGSLTLVLEASETFITNRPATVGHEIIGHGRSHRLGYTDLLLQHVFPIQVENLIMRVMGISKYRDGTRHAPVNTFIPNYMSLPAFR